MKNKVLDEMKKIHKNSIQAYDTFIELMEDMLLEDIVPTPGIGEFSTVFLARYINSLEAYKLLVLHGYEEDANAHLRNILESVITFIYISNEPEERIQLFEDYRYIYQYKLLMQVDKYRPYYYFDNLNREEIDKNYKSVKHRYKSMNRWSDKSIKEMALEIGQEAEEWYEFIYSMNSSFVHGDCFALDDLIEQDEYGTIIINIGGRDYIATELFARVIDLSKKLLIALCEINKIDTSNVVSTWKASMKIIIDEDTRLQDFESSNRDTP